MSRATRERKKANRATRIVAEQEARYRAARRRKIFGIAGAVVVVAGIAAVVAVLVAGGDDDEEAAPTTTATTAATSSTLPPTTMASAAGKPCVAVSEPLPAGAPEVPVQEGPPPAELVVEDLEMGDGTEATAGATVTVDYIGVACSTGAIFDNSYERGEPATFPLDGVIQGWTDGIPGMEVGGTRLLGIPSDQAYGPAGRPPEIAPDEALWFVVELREITPAG